METKKIIIGVVALALIGLAVYTFTGGTGKMTQKNSQEVANSQQTMVVEKSVYANGEYSAVGTYTSPAQEESIDVTLTIENDVVTDAQFKGNATNKTSVKMQDLFSEGYKEFVVGKKIDEIDLDVVNGSSLTPQGFEDALTKIKEQAKS